MPLKRRRRHLHECIDINPRLNPFCSDYKINVFEIAHLPKEKINLFKSDFKIVADYLSQKCYNERYEPSRDTIIHVDEMFKFFRAITADKRFETFNIKKYKKGELSSMDRFFRSGNK